MKVKYIFLCLFALTSFFSCQQEELPIPDPGSTKVTIGENAKIDFSIITSDFNMASSRMTNQQENVWDIVWVAQFDSNGLLVGTPKSYANTDMQIDVKVLSGTNTLYFVTNATENPFESCTSLSDFEQSVFTPESLTYTNDENAKLIMVGKWESAIIGEPAVDPSNPESEGQQAILDVREIVVLVERLTAKIDIIVDISIDGYQNKKSEVKSIQLCAAPKKARYIPGSKISASSDVDNFDAEIFDMPSEGDTKYISSTYYVLENMHGFGTEENQGGAEDKGTYAPKEEVTNNDLATYVLINTYIDDGVNFGNISYKIYLGKDGIKNFDIQRNHHYTITVKIRGIQNVTTDVRVDKNELSQIQLQKQDGSPATGRASEIVYIDGEKSFWGWDGAGAASSLNHLRIFTGGKKWTLHYMGTSTVPSNSSYVWTGLRMQYSNDKISWHDLSIGQAAEPNQDGYSYIRLHTGANNTSYERTATFRLRLYDDNSVSPIYREWRVGQYKADKGFNVPTFSFFRPEENVYSIAVRSSGDTQWNFVSNSNTSALTFIGTLGDEGFLSDKDTPQTGHGMIFFKAKAHSGIVGSDSYINCGTVTVNSKSPDDAQPTSWVTAVYQIPSDEQLLATKNNLEGNTKRFAWDYSSDALFTTVVGFRLNIPWSINMVSANDAENYDKFKTKMGAPSSVTGKANTLAMFNKMDKLAAEKLLSDEYTLPSTISESAAPIFSPAGICMALNDNFWEIDNVDHPNYQWYLPSRNEALMDAFVAMLKLTNGGNGSTSTIWTSTQPPNDNTKGAYTAGSSVDVSGTFSPTSTVRCIRRKSGSEIPDVTYPRLINENDNPVIVVKETISNIEKGFVDSYAGRPATFPPGTGNYADRYYNVNFPYRFTFENTPPSTSGRGPTHPEDLALSPKFQVAKNDVPISTNGMSWYQAAGWISDTDFTKLADPATGCQSYSETNGSITYNDWRLPTEMELRLIGLLGGATTVGANQQEILQNGGVNFTDIPGYSLIPNGRIYWGGSEYISGSERGSRAVYVTIYNLNNDNSPIAGSAAQRNDGHPTNKQAFYYARCVRDIR